MVCVDADNTMSSRSVPEIALEESNENGGHYFMNLYTGRRIHSHEWKELPIDDCVIERVKELAKNEQKKGRPITKEKFTILEWSPGVPIVDFQDNPTNDNNDKENNDDGDAQAAPLEEDDFPLLDDNNEDNDENEIEIDVNNDVCATDNEEEENEEIDKDDDNSLAQDPDNDLDAIDEEPNEHD